MPAKRHSLQQQIETAVERATTQISDTRVNRVLNLLSDQNLIVIAAEQGGGSGPVTIECVDIPAVWEDERIRSRVAELEQQGISVATEQSERDIAGMIFKPWVIRVQY